MTTNATISTQTELNQINTRFDTPQPTTATQNQPNHKIN
jgi:hypothetical protein